MKEFINFIKSAHFFLLFLVLETVSVFLIVRNTEKEIGFINSANVISGFFQSEITKISNYFSLISENEKLVKENNLLHNYINFTHPEVNLYSPKIQNSGYFYKSAKVVKNSVNKPFNILTVDKGSQNGIHENMAVVSNDGVVGVTAVIGKKYSTIISILNTKLEISAKVKRTNYHGIIKWDGNNPEYVILTDIPVYSSLYVGDKIVTGGYSAIFPENITIGTVSEFEKDIQSTFYNIKVKLSQDFRKLDYVYLIDYRDKEERIQLEDSTITRYQFNRF